MIKTIVVSAANHQTLALAPQLEMLPYRLLFRNEETTYEVIRHSAPATRVRGNRADANFDFALTVDREQANWTKQPGRLPRGKKSQQDIEIAKAGFGIELFVPLNSYTDFNFGFDPNKSYVIKPEHGARGIGQILIPSRVPVDLILETIKAAGGISDILEKHPAIQYNTHGERRENEGWAHIKERNFFVQEFVSGISSEIRLLLSVAEKKTYCGVTVRQRSTGIYPQASGGYEKTGKIHPLHTGQTVLHALDTAFSESMPVAEYAIYAEVLPQIGLFIERLGLTFGSVDLFFKKDSNGKVIGWGVFEYSTEFGYTSFNAAHVQDMVIAWYLEQVRNHVNQQSDELKIPLPTYGD